MDMVRKIVTACWLKGLLDQSAQGLVLNEDGGQGDYEEIKT
jgi:hypothetical protein